MICPFGLYIVSKCVEFQIYNMCVCLENEVGLGDPFTDVVDVSFFSQWKQIFCFGLFMIIYVII